MNKQALIALLLSVLTLSALYFKETKTVDEFQNWKLKFGSPYDAEEELYRRLIFEKNLKMI